MTKNWKAHTKKAVRKTDANFYPEDLAPMRKCGDRNDEIRNRQTKEEIMKNHFVKKMDCVMLVLIFALLFLTVAEAAEPGNPVTGFSGKWVSEAELDTSGPSGEVGKTGIGASLMVPLRLNDHSSLEFEFSVEQSSYDWSATENIGFSNGREPWETLSSAGMGLKYVRNWNQRWSGLAGASLGAAWEKETSDALSYGAYIGAICRTGENLTWIIGAGVSLEPEKVRILPLVGVSWNQVGPGEYQPGFSASIGMPKTEIRYSFNEVLDVYCNAEMEAGIYRLEDDSPVSPSGLVEMEGFSTGLFADIRPMKPLQIAVGLIYLFNREWELQDKDGDEISTVEMENAVGASIMLNWTF
ncbi:MAG: hypothetical protein B6245_04775 [Desulfobacteraceae bacterium 4572_88]|nr:MAG: hypothetical protein B6245_04775 [Desulfobacteraceae bacterium 4572_88]